MSADVGPQWRIAYAEKVRTAMNDELRRLADVQRKLFDVKLTWLETPSLTVGTEPDWGVPTQWQGERKRA